MAARQRRIWKLNRSAPRDLIKTLRRLDISCGLEVRDSVYFTLDESARELWREVTGPASRAGLLNNWIYDRSNALSRGAGRRGEAPLSAASKVGEASADTRGRAAMAPWYR